MLNVGVCLLHLVRSSTTEQGLRTASVSWPPPRNPTYPGGAPTSLATECGSMYSLMSMRTCVLRVEQSAGPCRAQSCLHQWGPGMPV
jgi:hypothetical protein